MSPNYPPIPDELATLQDELADLRAWKESAMAVEREWDLQAMVKSLGDVKSLGRSCREVIQETVKEIPKLRQRAALCDKLAEALLPIVAEFDSDPRSTQCFDGRVIMAARRAINEFRAIQPK